ncbi:hypothetical protein BC830DRAFT_1124553, partial [Chytriomyces sp. MP71]
RRTCKVSPVARFLNPHPRVKANVCVLPTPSPSVSQMITPTASRIVAPFPNFA